MVRQAQNWKVAVAMSLAAGFTLKQSGCVLYIPHLPSQTSPSLWMATPIPLYPLADLRVLVFIPAIPEQHG